jgi:methanogenic corrinoid protein MtbC1
VAGGWSAREAAVEAARSDRAPGAGPAGGDALVAAAAELDGDAVGRLLDEQFAKGSFESVVDEWLMPSLARLGQAWSHGEVSVAGEHLASTIVMRRLAAAYEAAGRGVPGPPVLIGAPPEVDHEIGLLAFATAARRAGLATVYLGAQVPADAWQDAALKVQPRHVVTSLHRRKDASRLRPVAEALADQPGVTLWVGGRHQDLASPPWQPLGHSIATAAQALAGR